MERGVLAIWNDCGENREEEYETWYLGEHFLNALVYLGFIMAVGMKRWKTVLDILPIISRKHPIY